MKTIIRWKKEAKQIENQRLSVPKQEKPVRIVVKQKKVC